MDQATATSAMLDQLRGVLASAGRPAGDPTTGTSDDGLVTAEVGPDGRVRSLHADPRARRHPETLAASVVEAVNDAVDQLGERAAGAANKLLEGLRAVQDESAALMARSTAEWTAAVRRMEDLHR